MSSPSAITTSPASRWNQGSRKNRTNVPANAPSSVNTIVKPRMNSRIGRSGRRPSPSVARLPVMNPTYPGTSGRTHGLAKDTTPAANARAGAHHDESPSSTSAASIGPSLPSRPA